MPIQLSGSGSITGVSTLTSLASLDVTGSVSVGGTLIYDDVTNIDSIGIVTARSDVHVGSALSVTGISTFGNSLHVTSGSVGIGTENPESDQLLTIHGTSNYKAGIRLRQSSTNIFKLIPEGGTGHVYYDVYGITNLLVGDHIFRVKNGQEKLRIKSDGNVGVGDDNPSVPFNVKAGGASFAGQITHAKIEDTTSLAANVGGLLAFEGVYNSNGDPACYAMIHGGKTNADNGNYAGYLRFLTRPSGALPQERLRITSDGQVIVNGTGNLGHPNMDDVIVGDASGNRGITVASGTSNYGTVAFGDSADGSGTDRYEGFIEYYHNDNSMRLGTVHQERLRITSGGLVGVNCTPLSQFQVKGGTNANIGLTIMGGEAAVEAFNDAGTASVPLRLRGEDFKFYTSSTETLRITSSGVVGINTDVSGNGSGAKLVVGGRIQSNAGGYWIAGANGAEDGWHVQQSSDDLVVVDSGVAERLRIDSSGHLLHGVTADEDTSGSGGLRFINTGDIQIDGDQKALVFRSTNNTAQLQSAIEWWNENGAGVQAKIAVDRTAVSQAPSDLVFYTSANVDTSANNSEGDITERVRIASDGKVGINNTDPQTTLNVRGTISTGRNLAREVGTVISSSTNFNSSRQASNVINGKKNYENGGNDWLTAGGSRNNANLVIDLGAQYNVDRVVIYNQNEYSTSHREVRNFNLEGSNDNSSWTLLIDDELGRSDAHEPNPGFSFRLPHVSIPGGMHDDSEGVSYRYWRFTMKDFHDTDSYGGIMEIELYQASDAVDSEVTTHSLVAGDVYTQTLSAKRLAIGENGALGDFRANANESVYINAAARFGQNTSDSSGNASRHTGWRMYGYCPDGVNNRLQYTMDGLYGRKSFYYYFPHGSANQAIRFHSNRNSFWTCGFITINGNYSHQNASGMLRYHFTHNANGTSSYNKTIDVDVNIGSTSSNFGMSNNYTFKSWGSNGGSTTSHALELRHLNSNGNGVYVTIELYGNHVYNYIDDLYMTTGHTY